MMSPPWAKQAALRAAGRQDVEAAREAEKRESSEVGSLFHETDSENEEDDEARPSGLSGIVSCRLKLFVLASSNPLHAADMPKC